MQTLYTINICGREETLPILTIGGGVNIAFFNLHGNRKLTDFCASKLAERIAPLQPDILLTAESKGLQLTHVVAGLLHHDFYAVARKSKKLYMQDGEEVSYHSITTGHEQTLYLSAHDCALLKGKRVCIVDDVVSTGGSLLALETLTQKAGGTVAGKAAVLAEGAAAKRKDLIFLGELPLL